MILVVTSVACALLFLVGAGGLAVAWVRRERKRLRITVAAALSMLAVSVTGLILHLMATFQQLGAVDPAHKQAILAAGLDGFGLPGLFATAGWGSLLIAAVIVWVTLRRGEAREGTSG